CHCFSPIAAPESSREFKIDSRRSGRGFVLFRPALARQKLFMTLAFPRVRRPPFRFSLLAIEQAMNLVRSTFWPGASLEPALIQAAVPLRFLEKASPRSSRFLLSHP